MYTLPRKLISLSLASCLLGFGLFLLGSEITGPRSITGKLSLMGIFLASVGGVWLWVDFIEPLWRREDRE